MAFELKNIIASEKSILFQTNSGVFVGNCEESNYIDPEGTSNPDNNKWNFIVEASNQMIENLYPLSAFSMQSYQYKTKPSNRSGSISDFREVFTPTEVNIQDICQFFSFGYMLSDITTKGVDIRDITYSGYIPKINITRSEQLPKTYVYPSSAIIIGGGEAESEVRCVPIYNLSGVQYNYIDECPLDLEYYGYDRDLTDTDSYYYSFGDTFNCKNAYDDTYSLNSFVNSGASTQEVSANLIKARQYYGIGSTGGALYAIYKNNTEYNSAINTLSGGVTYGMTPDANYNLTGSTFDIPMNTKSETSGTIYDMFENVEELYSLNILSDTTKHKANLYSINIQNANLNTSSIAVSTQETVKRNINRIIENMVKNVTPANTQLFNIYWNGE